MHHIGTKTTVIGLNRKPGLRVLSKEPWKAEPLKRLLDRDCTRVKALRHGSATRLRNRLADFSQLNVRTEAASQAINELARLRVLPDGLWASLLNLQKLLHLLASQVGRCQILRNRGMNFIRLLAFFSRFLGRRARLFLNQVGAETADLHFHALKVRKRNRARSFGLNFALFFLHLLEKPLLAEVEFFQVRNVLTIAFCDFVERIFHLRGEAQVHQLLEVILKKLHDRKARERRNQSVLDLPNITAVHDGRQNGCVSGRTPNSGLFHALNERCFCEARWRLGFMPQGFHLVRLHTVTGCQSRQDQLAIVERGLSVVRTFHVSANEAGEQNPGSIRLKDGILGLNLHAHRALQSFGHLSGHGALPNQLIKSQFTTTEACVLRMDELLASRANGFVSFLSTFGFGFKLARLRRQVFLAVEFFDLGASGFDRFLRQTR